MNSIAPLSNIARRCCFLSLSALSALTLITPWGCTPTPPTITEVNLPRASQDAEGPYLITARVVGSVDSVRLVWTRRAPEGVPAPVATDDALNAQGMINALNDPAGGEVWTALLSGGFPVADYGLRVIASNSAGESAYPSEGEAIFEVRALTGACVADSECLEGEVCHRAEGYCFTPPSPCTADPHCPRDQFCNRQTGACRFYDSACEGDAECAAGYLCDEGVCRQPCGGACALGYVCDGFSCVAPPCDSAADCPAQLPLCEEGRCAPLPNECDPPCAGGDVCVARECVSGPCGSEPSCEVGLVCLNERCAPCTADGQCGAGRYCELGAWGERGGEGRCVEGARGRLCAPCGLGGLDASVCGADLVCSASFTGCRQPCVDSSDCSQGSLYGGSYCDLGVCVGDYALCSAYDCMRDEECAGGSVCELGYCVLAQVCAGDSDCASDRRCVGGACRPAGACDSVYGERCPGRDVCVAGRCEPPVAPISLPCVVCGADTDCGPQEVCTYGDLPQRTCARLCDDDAHCAEDEFCSVYTNYESICMKTYYYSSCDFTELACFPDAYEPNNSYELAAVLSDVDTLFIDGSACLDDVDWFILEEPARSDVYVNTYSSALIELTTYDERLRSTSSYVLYPYSDDVVLIARGTQYLSLVSVSLERGSDGYYELSSQGPCYEDAYEPNNAASEAASVYGLVDGSLCLNDIDWYRVSVTAGQSLYFELSRYRYTSGTFRVTMRTSRGDTLWFIEDFLSDFLVVDRSEDVLVGVACDGCSGDEDYFLDLSAR